MGWEWRGKHRFYYRTHRAPGGGFTRAYHGGGLAGAMAAQAHEQERVDRASRSAQEKAERVKLSGADELLEMLNQASDLFMRASLLANGFHQHARGNWRWRDM